VTELHEMIAAQRDLQEKLGYHFEQMTQNERIEYIKESALALTDEVHEALAETGWKSWATSRHVNREPYLGELRDAWQFLTNMMLAAEPDPVTLAEWLSSALAKKHRVNHDRIGAYDGVTTKCPSCSRALEDVTITELPHLPEEERFRCVCGVVLDPVVVRYLSGS